MNEVVAIVEGETEQTFVRDQLAAHLALRGTTIWAVLPGRQRKQGGVKKWIVAKADIVRTLRENRYCTTMFDYYAMPDDWPGRASSRRLAWQRRAEHVQTEMLAAITAEMGQSFNSRAFLPYVQLHEFEARPLPTWKSWHPLPPPCRIARSSSTASSSRKSWSLPAIRKRSTTATTHVLLAHI